MSLRSVGGGALRWTLCPRTQCGVLTLSNPRRRNALSGHMMVALASWVDMIEAGGDDTWAASRAIVVRGDGDTFCAGADMSSVLDSEETGYAMSELMRDTLTRFRSLPRLTVALVSGHAIGGGAELACAPDLRIWNDTARMQFVQVQRGVVPGWGGSAWLRSIVGPQRTMSLLLTGKPVNPKFAESIGLADAVVSSDRSSSTDDGELPGPMADWLADWLGSPEVERVPVMNAAKRVAWGTLDDEKREFDALWGGPARLAAMGPFGAK